MVSTQLPGIHNEDILLSIFSFLSIPDLARCAAVCKQWHEVVTGSTHLWKGKRYTSKRSRIISAEMRAILCALPRLCKAEVQVRHQCYVDFSYPCLSLTVFGISDLQAVRDWQKVSCTYLSVHLNVADFFFSSQSPIDFSALQKLNITNLNWIGTPIKTDTRAVCAISCALQLCPNLRELSICIDSLSADYLDALEGMSHLQTLRINCNGVEKQVSLRHSTELLEELELVFRFNEPSSTLGLRSLMSLQLSMYISFVSIERHCERLQEVSIVVRGYMLTDWLRTVLRQLPTSVCSLLVIGSAASAVQLWDYLPYLPSLNQLSISCGKLDRLDFLRGCPQLRRLCLDYLSCLDKSQLLNLRHLSQLETLEMPGNSDDLAFLSTVIPSLPQLDTLTVRDCSRNVDYVGLLQDLPRLRSLSLFDNCGKLCDMSQLGKLYIHKYGYKYVCQFFHEVV